MGARLVGATFDPHWSQTLTYGELRVLTAMALSALDTARSNQPADIYFGGEIALVIALTGTEPHPSTVEFRTHTNKVGRIVKRLLEARAIERVTDGRRGQKAVYRLTLSSHLQPLLPVDNLTHLSPRKTPLGGENHPL